MTKERLIKVSDFEKKIKIFIPHLKGAIDDLENLLNSTDLEEKVNAIGALNEIINFFNDRICEFRIKGKSNELSELGEDQIPRSNDHRSHQ